ncbi:MAG: fumarylacetoacetate hydrolase family protein [Hyphomicrobiaceae bacterium]
MKLATWTRKGRTAFGTVAEDGALRDLSRTVPDLRALIAAGDGIDASAGVANGAITDAALTPPIADGAKIICVGVNYPERNAEYRDGSTAPAYPSLFVRFPGSFVGHGAPLVRPRESLQFDYEGEIVLVIGKPGRRIPEARAHEHIFGLTLMNEGSVRDWLRHGKFNVTQGKNFDASGSLGPWIVTRDAAGDLNDLTLVTRVNGEERQRGNTGTLMFSFARIIAYVSTFTTLEPGDLIATGTPPGAGGRFDPPKWLVPGDVVEVECPGIGLLSNPVSGDAG